MVPLEVMVQTETTTAARAAAGYRAGTGFRRCWNCEHFSIPAGDPGEVGADDRPQVTCTLLGGTVEPTAVCDRWVHMADRARKRTGFRSAQRQHGRFLWDEPGGGDGGGGSTGGAGGPVGL